MKKRNKKMLGTANLSLRKFCIYFYLNFWAIVVDDQRLVLRD